MKTFTFKIAVLGLITIFSMNSCSKNSAFQSPAIKILGTWKIDKVKFLKDFSLGRRDVTQDFSGTTYLFNEDESVVMTAPTETLQGTWNIENTYNSNSQNSYGTSCALVSAMNNTNGTITIHNWNNLYVTKSKLTGEERRDGGTYYYTLSKQ